MSSSSCPLFNKSRDTTDHFSHLHLSNRLPCKRPCSHNSFANQLKPKKPNNNPKIVLSSPIQETQPFLRRFVSDLYGYPTIAMVVETTPHSPVPNPEIEVPKTPFSNANALAKLPLRPPALRRSVPDPMPSPANTFSTSSQSPNPEWLRKKSNCTREMSRKWDELSGYTEDSTKAELGRDNSGEIINETVSVEKIGEALIIHLLCPCGAGYRILLLGGNCFYMLTQM